MIKIYMELGDDCDFGPYAAQLHQFYVAAKTVDMKLKIKDQYIQDLNAWIDVECSQKLLELWDELENKLTGMGLNVDWIDNTSVDFELHQAEGEDLLDPDLATVGQSVYEFTGIVTIDDLVSDRIVNAIRLSTDYRVEKVQE